MGRFLLRWLFLAIAMILAAIATSAIFKAFGATSGFSVRLRWEEPAHIAGDFVSLLLGVGLFALINAILGPVLKAVSLPLNCMTLGLFSFVINAALFLLAGQIGLGFEVTGFMSALVGSIVFSFINGVLEKFVKDNKEKAD